jgi:hypothetical protein
MYIVITQFTRPSTDVQYYINSVPEVGTAFFEFTAQHPELISELIKHDVSELVQISYAIYEDEDKFNQFIELFNIAFPTFFTDRDLYCQNNNILIERSVENS